MSGMSVFESGLFGGKSVLVSGGTSGIGLAIAEGFVDAGAEVLATGSSTGRVETAQQNNSRSSLRFDLLDVRDMDVAKKGLDALDRLDVLVNCQGIARPEDEWEEDTFMNVIDINLSSVMRLSRLAYPRLRQSKGNIINIASMLSYLADPLVPAYCASKSGIVGLTRALAHRYGEGGVRVNAIAPGYHKTDMTKAIWSDPVQAEKISSRAALKRWGTVEDLIGPALYLASDAASFVTGAIIPVDGGYHTG